MSISADFKSISLQANLIDEQKINDNNKTILGKEIPLMKKENAVIAISKKEREKI